MSEDTLDDFLRALLRELSPGEALLLKGKPLNVARTRSPRREEGETAINFGVSETAIWLAPVLVVIGKWLLDAAQEPLKKKLQEFVERHLDFSSATQHKSITLDSSPLDELSNKFGELCQSAGVSPADLSTLRGLFVVACVDNALLLKRVIA